MLHASYPWRYQYLGSPSSGARRLSATQHTPSGKGRGKKRLTSNQPPFVLRFWCRMAIEVQASRSDRPGSKKELGKSAVLLDLDHPLLAN